jgi:hypothetical protein
MTDLTFETINKTLLEINFKKIISLQTINDEA